MNPGEIPQWITDEQTYFDERYRSVEGGIRSVEEEGYEEKCENIDRRLNYTENIENVLDPLGGIQETTTPRNPTAMEKVDAEFEKQDEWEKIEDDIKYQTTKEILPEKEDKHVSYQSQKDRDLFERHLNLKEDRTLVKEYEDEKARIKRMQNPGKREGIIETNIQAKKDLNREVLEGESELKEQARNENRKATIDHKGHEWDYEKKGDQERFYIKNEHGTPLVTIEKLDNERDFDAENNAVYLNNNAEMQAESLEPLFESLKEDIDRLKQQDQERREALKDKAKDDFNQNYPPPNNGSSNGTDDDNPSPDDGGTPPTSDNEAPENNNPPSTDNSSSLEETPVKQKGKYIRRAERKGRRVERKDSQTREQSSENTKSTNDISEKTQSDQYASRSEGKTNTRSEGGGERSSGLSQSQSRSPE